MDQVNTDSHSWPLLFLFNALYIKKNFFFSPHGFIPAFSRSSSVEDHFIQSSEPSGKVSTEVLGSTEPTLSPSLAAPPEIHLSSAVRKVSVRRQQRTGPTPQCTAYFIHLFNTIFKEPRHFNITKLS